MGDEIISTDNEVTLVNGDEIISTDNEVTLGKWWWNNIHWQ